MKPAENLRDSLEQVMVRESWQLYTRAVLLSDRLSHFGHLHVPQALLLGQSSTDKTSMVKWVIGRDSVLRDVRLER